MPGAHGVQLPRFTIVTGSAVLLRKTRWRSCRKGTCLPRIVLYSRVGTCTIAGLSPVVYVSASDRGDNDMNARASNPGLVVWCLVVAFAHTVQPCSPFPRSNCSGVLACEFGCEEHKHRILNLLRSRLSSTVLCGNDDARLAHAVVSRDTSGCNRDLKQAIDRNQQLASCPIPDNNAAALCNYKAWYTHRQTLLASIMSGYIVVLNLVAWVM